MTVVVTHTTPSDGTFSAEGAAAWDANHGISGLGTAAEKDVSYFATAAQGALADTAVQPGSLGTMAYQNANNVTITGGTIGGQSVADVGNTSTLAKLCLMGS